jgi:hypothetical protein
MNEVNDTLSDPTNTRIYLKETIFHFWNDKILFGGVCAFCLSIFMLAITLHEHIITQSDLIEVKGGLLSYSVYRAGKGVHHGITLLNSQNDFVVAIDMMDDFLEAEFQKNVKPGDCIVLTVPKSVANSDQPQHNVWVFGIKDTNATYLNPDTTLPNYKSSRRNIVVYIFFFGLILFFGRLSYLYSIISKANQ